MDLREKIRSILEDSLRVTDIMSNEKVINELEVLFNTRPTPEANKHIGSNFDDFLEKEGLLEECTPEAIQVGDTPDLNKRVKQGTTIDELVIIHCKTHQCCMDDNKSELVNAILDCKYVEAIKDIEWVGDCRSCHGKKVLNWKYKSVDCHTCKGKGTITRQATMGEVVEWGKLSHMALNPRFWDSKEHEAWHSDIPNMMTAFEALRNTITVNGGTLRIKP